MKFHTKFFVFIVSVILCVSVPQSLETAKGAITPTAGKGIIQGFIFKLIGTERVGVDDVKVGLYDAFEKFMKETETTEGGSYSFEVEPGYYMIKVKSQMIGKTIYFEQKSDIFRVEEKASPWHNGTTNLTLDYRIEDCHASGKVVLDDGSSVGSKANVCIIDIVHNWKKNVTTDANGWFNITFYNGTYILQIDGTGDKAGYSYYESIVLEPTSVLALKPRKLSAARRLVVIENDKNPKIMENVTKKSPGGSEVKLGKENYTIDYKNGMFNLTSKAKVANYDEIKIKYHYIKQAMGARWDENLTKNGWDGMKTRFILQFPYYVLNSTLWIYHPAAPHNISWSNRTELTRPGNYTLNNATGELTLIPTEKYLFNLSLNYTSFLGVGRLHTNLTQAFTNQSINLSANATISRIDDNNWRITDGASRYIIKKIATELKVYAANIVKGDKLYITYITTAFGPSTNISGEIIIEAPWDGETLDYWLNYGTFDLAKEWKIYRDSDNKKLDPKLYTLNTTIGFFKIEDRLPFGIWLGNANLRIDYATWERTGSDVFVMGKNDLGTRMLTRYIVSGDAVNATTGEFISSKIYVGLYSKTNEKLLENELKGPRFKLNVPEKFKNDEFILIVHPEGYNAYTDLSFIPDFQAKKEHYLGLKSFTKQEQDKIETTIIFGKNATNVTDWNNITIYTNSTLKPGSVFSGLGNEKFGDIRLQIDFKFGMGPKDGKLNITEREKFLAWLEARTPEFVSTEKIFRIDNTAYNTSEAATNILELDFGEEYKAGSSKPITLKTAVTCNVEKNESEKIKSGKALYTINIRVKYDTPVRNHSYYLKLPTFYERTASTENPQDIYVNGSRIVTIDPKERAGKIEEELNLTVRLTKNPVAKAKIVTGPKCWAYKLPKENNSYLVAINQNVTFDANESYSPVGKIMYYRWNFGDGTNWTAWSHNKSIKHRFNTTRNPFANYTNNYTVQLEVKDSYGNITRTNDTTNITVHVDEVPPTPKIEVNKTTHILMGNRTIVVSVGDALRLQGENSTDFWVKGDNFTKGNISSYLWNFGDGTSNGTTSNLTHVYSKPGWYNISLNVTDMVGLCGNVSLSVIVKPQVSFRIYKQDKPAEDVTSAVEDTELVFNATASKSAANPKGTLVYFNWSFVFTKNNSPPTNLTGEVVKFRFPKGWIGNWNVTLSITDNVNQSCNITKLISVRLGKRPDLAIAKIWFVPTTTEEGKETEICVLITNCLNTPSATADNATNITVRFYDGNQPISGTVRFYNSTGALIGEGILRIPLKVKENVTAKIRWKAVEGNRTIKVNVSCPDEYAGTTVDNERTATIEVAPAGWKVYAVWAGVGAVVIVGLILVYLWKKGKLRRARAEEEEEKVVRRKGKEEIVRERPKKVKKRY